MGNTESSEDDPLEQFTAEATAESSSESSVTDYGVLLDEESLKKALSKYPDVDLAPIARQSDRIRKWLNGMMQHGSDVTVTLDEFVHTVKEYGVPPEECRLFFHHLDRYGEGSIAAVTLLSELTGMSTKLSNILTGLIPCRLEPNVCDVFVDDKSSCSDFAVQLMEFLQRNRASSNQLVAPSVETHHSMMKLRESYVKACFSAKISEEDAPEDTPEGQRVMIPKCYTQVMVSSNQSSQDNLTDNNSQTYWQSNGTPRTHWIRVALLPGTVISELSVTVESSDESYMPQHITVSVGNVKTSLKEIKTVFIPKDTTGKYVLLKNVAIPYKFAQVNIKRCHRDGCDTRIRGIHVRGCRYVVTAQPSVFDSVAIWYLSMMSTTAQATMPLAPNLKPLLLQQTKATLCSLNPLALSPTAQDKPAMLDSFVITELTKFIKSLCQKGDSPGTAEIDPEQLNILLKYMLIIGDVNGILDTLQSVLENMHLSLPCQPLLKNLADVADAKRTSRAIALHLAVQSCDGGEKDSEYKVDNCIMADAKPSTEQSSSARPYVTEEGKKVVNLVVQHHKKQQFDVQRILLAGQKGGQSPKLAVVFLLRKLPSSGKLFEHYSQYNSLEKEELEKLVDKENKESDPTCAKPVAVIELGAEGGSTVTFDRCTPCTFVYVKFLGTKDDNAERMGIQKVAIYGHHLEECDALHQYHKVLNVDFPIPSEPSAPSVTLIGRVIGFLIQMLLDLKVIKDRLNALEQDLHSLTEAHVSIESLTLEKVWSLYFPFAMESNQSSKKLSFLCLLLLYSSLPFINQGTGKQASSESSDTNKSILTHLCSLIDSDNEDQMVKDVAKECIVTGIPVFYSTPSARQEHLMEMLSSVSGQQSKSWMLKFKGLCQYFVVKDSFKLLQLPVNMSSADQVKIEDVMKVLTTIVDVTCQQVDLSTKETDSEEREILVYLLQAIQQNLFHWCMKASEEKKQEWRELASCLVLRYSVHFLEKMEDLLPQCVRMQSAPSPSGQLTVATSVLPQMLYFLTSMRFSNSFYSLKLLPHLRGLMNSLSSIQKKHPELFPTSVSKPDTLELESEPKKDADQSESHVLNVWVRESSSSSEEEVTKDEKFFCPTATKMVVEFDPVCSTSRRFDKLEFISGSTSSVTSVHGVYGSSEWPKTLELATSELSFRFTATSASSSWTYKFVVRAYGPKPQSLAFFSNLQLTVAHVMGGLCSHVLALQYTLDEDDEQEGTKEGESEDKKKQEIGVKAEKWLIGSDVWKKLFRAGMTDKFTRSLSTMHSSVPVGTKLNEQLLELAEGRGGMNIVKLCRADHNGPQMHYGGPQVDKAITAVFAALVWHSQVIRDELGDKPLTVIQGVKDAYAMAQYLRRELVEARQKVVLAKDSEEFSTKQAPGDEDKPVNDCLNKALFLLKFAGLARDKKLGPVEGPSSSAQSSFVKKYRQLQKVSSISTSPDLGAETQGLSVVETEKTLAAKHPSFSIMMEFLRKANVTKDMVERFLEHRQKAAKNLSAVLHLISDLLKSMDIFSSVGLSFLRQLLSCQHNFARHYICDLEGCGFDVENEVRSTYRQITAHLLEELRPYTQLKTLTKPPTMEVLLAEAYLLHLFDVQWQNYDMSFVAELQLPAFLLGAAIQAGFNDTLSLLPTQENEEEMLTRHKLFTRYLSVVKSSTSLAELMASLDMASLDKEIHLFIVSAVWHTQKMSISVQCDGCTTSISSTWYRDTEARDLDLCRRCFFDRPDKRPQEYHISHKFLELRYLCDCCRIMITSHRLHSETKDDFDLCLGCFRQKEAEGSLDPKDKWTLYPVTLHTPEKDKVNAYYTTAQDHVTGVPVASAEKPKEKKLESLKAYISQHAFLQFTQICLSTAQALNVSENDVEESYLNTIAVIYFDCLKLLTFCLRCAIAKSEESAAGKEDTDSAVEIKDPGKIRPTLLRVTSVTDHPEVFSEMGEMEKSFCYNKMDRLMGLLALMLPVEKQLPKWVTRNPNVSQLLSERLLPSLIDISRSKKPEHSVQALCLLSQFLVRLNPETADQACQMVQGEVKVEESGSGLRTVEYLCSTGALHLEKSDFASASTVSKMVIKLGGCGGWKVAVAHQLKRCLDRRPQDMVMEDIFKLYTLAGFPALPCIGTVMEFGEGSEARRAVITSVNANQVSLVTLDKRETMISSLQTLRMQDPPVGCVEETHIAGLVGLLEQLHKLSRTSFTTETLFVLSLTLKALRTAITTVDPANLEALLSDSKMMSWIGAVARKPTEMDKKWLLHHLEAYLVSSYHQRTKKEGSEVVAEAPKDEEEPEKKKSVKKDPKEGLTGMANDMFDTMLDAFNCTPAVLRAAYDISDGDVERWLVLLQNSFENSVFKPSDRVLEKAKEWEPQPVQVIAEKIQETGDDSGLVNFSPRKIDIENVTAVAEIGSLKPKVSVDLKDSKDEKDKDAKMERVSLEMLLKELKKLPESRADSNHLFKTANAVAILQARELIVSILTHWPWRLKRMLSLKVLLGEADIMKNFGMVDLICSTETDCGAKMVVKNIMEYGDPGEVQDLVVAAAECMGELMVGTECVEWKKTEEKTVTGTIAIRNASSLTVTFNEKSNFKGKIALTSSVQGTGEGRFEGNQLAGKMHILPGDTVNYKVTYSSEDSSAYWKMEIVGSQTGRFETGCMILKMWLSQARTKKWNLPLADLWPHLVLVACQNPGQKRLQVIGLLLKILALYRETKISKEEEEPVKELDLGLLKPLWKLYYTILGEVERNNEKLQLVPDIVKALTELFMVMESFGKDLGADNQLLNDLWVNEKVMSIFKEGVSNVAYISLGAGLTNAVSTIFVESKRKQDLGAIASLSFPTVEGDKEDEDGTISSPESSTSDDSDDYTTTDDDDDDEDLYLYSD
jgi:hypothetical protein